MTNVFDGRWRVDSWIGRGATTARGTDLQTQERVVIKVLDLGQLDSWKDVELFEREAAVLRGLDHPQLPKVLASFEQNDGKQFVLVQEYLGAPSVSSRALEPWDEIRLRAFATSALGILCYLHGFSPPVIHRDLEPANLLVDDHGQASIVDFGSVQRLVAKRLGGSTIVGTSGYMAPEQLTGNASPSSDLFSLGMVMVYLATGKDPAQLPSRGLEVVWENECRTTVSSSMRLFVNTLIAPHSEDRFASTREALRAISTPARAALVVAKPVSTRVEIIRTKQAMILKCRQPMGALLPHALLWATLWAMGLLVVVVLRTPAPWNMVVTAGLSLVVVARIAFNFTRRGQLRLARSGYTTHEPLSLSKGKLTDIRSVTRGAGEERGTLSLGTEHGMVDVAHGLSLQEREWAASEIEQFLNSQGVYFRPKG